MTLEAFTPELLWVETFRDWVIIFMGIAVGAFFLVSLIIAIVLGLLMRVLLRKVSALMDDSVRPLLDNAKTTTGSVKGTATYVSQAAVQPIVRAYGVVAGVRRAASVLAGLTGASTDDRRPNADDAGHGAYGVPAGTQRTGSDDDTIDGTSKT